MTQGTVRFHVPDAPESGLKGYVVDAKAGEFIVVPTRAPHTFSNETDEEARFINTFTPVRIPLAVLSVFILWKPRNSCW